MNGKVYCLNADGGLVWSHTFARDTIWPDRTGLSSIAIGPTASGEMRAYVGCDNGYLYCLSLDDSPQQRVLWEHDAGACIESSPTVYAGNVYAGLTRSGGIDLIALDASSGAVVWEQNLQEEVRATSAAADGGLFAGVDTGHELFRLDSARGRFDPPSIPPFTNPFDASSHTPDPSGQLNYFVGSSALISAGLCFVGNDNYALYSLSSTDLSHLATSGTEGVVCSSPAISYAAQEGYRWLYVLSRADGGTLLAYRQQLSE